MDYHIITICFLLCLSLHNVYSQVGQFNQNVRYSSVSRLGTVPTNVAGCYQADVYYPSIRLPNSLENLIYLVEKVELSLWQQNIKPNASFMAALLLQRFQVNGISDIESRDDKTIKRNEAIMQDIVFKLLPNTTFTFPEGSLTDKEKCSLHYMVSTSVNETNYNIYMGYSYRDQYDPYNSLIYPRLNGALFTGPYGTLSGGPLLAGIAASAVNSNPKVRDMLYPEEAAKVDTGLEQILDPLMAVTLAGEIAQSVILYSFPQYKHAVLGPNGNWNGTVCPATYTLNTNDSSAATNPELLGAIDGMIIGNYLRNNYQFISDNNPLLLSQVLRTYYGRGFQGNNLMSGCDRRSQISQLLASMSATATAFATLYQAKGGSNTLQQFPDYSTISQAVQQAVQNFTNAYSDYFPCNATTYAQDCQTENDIIVVMDTSSSNTGYIDGYQEQKNFIGGLISRINVFPNNSHVGIMTYGGAVREPVPFNRDNSGAYIKCTLQWYNLLGGSNTDIAGTIRALQDRFRSIKNSQRTGTQAEAPGRVVIFIYQQSNVANIDDIRKAFYDFRYEHPDVLTLAVGSNKDALGNFVKDTTNDVFIQTGEQLSFAIDKVIQRLCKAPSLVEYRECNTGNNEQNYIADEFIYPDAYKWIAFNQWSFNKSTNLKINFQTTYGYARMCFSRYIHDIDPNTLTNCFETSQSNSLQVYQAGELCKNYGSNCPWLYVSVRGKSKGAQTLDRCAEMSCDSPNQIKLTITHQGARCGTCGFFSNGYIISLLLVCLCFMRHI